MAYDPLRERVVLFGGAQYPGTTPSPLNLYLDDTWEWDGTSWRLRTPRAKPDPRHGHAMAYDPITQQVILFGGADAAGTRSDTWGWDGQTWRRLQPQRAPSPRFYHTMATDPVRRKIVLFGGAPAYDAAWGPPPLADLWEWDGTDWTQVVTANGPEARYYHGSAWCARSRSVVVYHGIQGVFRPVRNIIWEWDGTQWRSFTQSLENVGITLLTEGLSDGTVVEFGYDPRVSKSYVYRWDGVQLTRAETNWPIRDAGPACMSDHARKRIVQFGGSLVSSAPYRPGEWPSDTWTWDGQAWRLADGGWRERLLQSPIVYHEKSDQVLLPLGLDSTGSANTTYTLQNDEWVTLNVASPSLPYGHAVDVAHLGKVMLTGVNDRKQFETWLFDGSTWTRVASVQQPPVNGAMTYDRARRRVVLLTYGSQPGQLWEWNELQGWLRQNPAATPPATSDRLGMAYDAARQRTVVFGPGRASETFYNDIWEWDGSQWYLMKTTVVRPPVRSWCQLVYVPSLRGVLMLGSGQGFTDTWLWDGSAWTSLATNAYPAQAHTPFHSAILDAPRQRVLAPYPANMVVTLGAFLWQYRASTLSLTEYHPRPGQPFKATVSLPGHGGLWSLLALSGTERPGLWVDTIAGPSRVPLGLDPILLLTLQAGLLRQLDAQGMATFDLALPNARELVGLRLHAGAIAVTASGAIAAITTSARLDIVQ